MITPAKDNLPIAPANARKGSTSPILPYVGEAMRGWFAPMKLGIVRSVLEDYETREEVTWKKFRGVVVPLNPQKLVTKPEGQRAWIWKMVHCDVTLELNLNDIVVDVDNQRYRVMAKSDYSSAGYYRYEIAQDYKEYNGL